MYDRRTAKVGSTKDLLHWQYVWAGRFLRTWFHIFYRPAYHAWKADQKAKRIERRFGMRSTVEQTLAEMDEGFGVWGDPNTGDL